ncbi:Uncharacterised protein [BD1-7 clade bacterium]|uniref:N-acetyltransferase domain-containing protein n=1 Tax=BD1-7 clade bacterium TaxID=2029982 RepID=A0A5S9P2N0_9GAMM|nr:Uncharacterised protein [BD1-7 clade bacterium]CAA0122792.1 Uncharacterised protein [BD1-7 clade bacterium]
MKQIQQAGDSDIESVNSIREACGALAISGYDYDWIDGERGTFIYKVEDKVVACLTFRPSGVSNEKVQLDIHVQPESQQKGFGTEFIEHALTHFKSECSYQSIEALLGPNEIRSKPFFTRMQFKEKSRNDRGIILIRNIEEN